MRRTETAMAGQPALCDRAHCLRWQLLVGFALVVVGLYAAGLNGHWRFRRDSALFLGLARSLAESRTFTFNFEPHRHALPGFPALLSLVYMSCGENFLVMNSLISLMGLGTILMASMLYRELSLTDRQAWACLLLLGLSHTLFFYSMHILSDVPYAFLAVVALYCGMRMARSNGAALWTWAGAAASAAGAAATVRPFAPALVIGLLVGLWLRPGARGRWKVYLAVSALLVLPILLFQAAWTLRCRGVEGAGISTYFDSFVVQEGSARVMRRLLLGVPRLLGTVPDILTGGKAGLLYGAPFVILVAAGFVASVRRREFVVCTCAAVHMAGMLLGSPSRRYMLPVLPLLVYWLVLGADRTILRLAGATKPLRRRRLVRIACALLLMLVAINLVRIADVVGEARSRDFYAATRPQMPDYFALCAWLRDNVDPRATVMAREGRLIHYLAGVHTYPVHVYHARLAGPRGVIEQARRDGVRYAVDEPGENGDVLQHVYESNPRAFERLPPFGRVSLMKVHLDRLGEPDQ